jgi:hypothetical protein
LTKFVVLEVQLFPRDTSQTPRDLVERVKNCLDKEFNPEFDSDVSVELIESAGGETEKNG